MRDSGRAAGDEALFGPVLNVKVFDYQLDIDGVEAITPHAGDRPGERSGACAVPGRAGRTERRDPRQRAALRRGDAKGSRGAAERNADAVCRRPGPALWQRGHRIRAGIRPAGARQRYRAGAAVHHAGGSGRGAGERNAGRPALADAHTELNYRQMREQVVALANLLRARGVKPGDGVAVALPRSVFLTLALHGIVEAGAPGCRWIPVTRMTVCG
ncbi:AMP-binding protein [Enterobacter hormaechei]